LLDKNKPVLSLQKILIETKIERTPNWQRLILMVDGRVRVILKILGLDDKFISSDFFENFEDMIEEKNKPKSKYITCINSNFIICIKGKTQPLKTYIETHYTTKEAQNPFMQNLLRHNKKFIKHCSEIYGIKFEKSFKKNKKEFILNFIFIGICVIEGIYIFKENLKNILKNILIRKSIKKPIKDVNNIKKSIQQKKAESIKQKNKNSIRNMSEDSF
jgi:hypothetical protein